MAASSPASINSERLKAIFDGINGFGRAQGVGGWSRPGFSAADMAVRRWFAERMEAEALRVYWDGAANVFGRLGPEGAPCVMIGSHLDTVPEGGAFDGALGVAVALECALAIRDAGLKLAYAVEVVATSEEEGRFGGMLGSQALAGLVTEEWLREAIDGDGELLTDAMAAQGLDPSQIFAAARRSGSVSAFLELHVEQGPVLERLGASIGIVDRVSAMTHLAVTLKGAANHSGTTPMKMRADAFAGLARIAVAIPDLISKYGGQESRITIGKVEVTPNFLHTIPGEAAFSIVLRDTEIERLAALADRLREMISKVAVEHNLGHEIVGRGGIPPTALAPKIVSLLEDEANYLGFDPVIMSSGAGHDAQTMQTICPSGLVFVPSRDGISHSPDEWTDWEETLKGARLMLAAATKLAQSENATGPDFASPPLSQSRR